MLNNAMRVSLNLPKSLVEKFDEIAMELCVPRTALINMALSQYIENKEAISTMGGLQDLVNRMEGYEITKKVETIEEVKK
jgi:metal-responsive CopG/Arc/MetJ family transcriptional regulator